MCSRKRPLKLHDRGICPNQPPALQQPVDAVDSVKYDQIACNGLKPKYNGAPSKLIFSLKLIHIRCQKETGCPATCITLANTTEVDLVCQFCQVLLCHQATCKVPLRQTYAVAIDRRCRRSTVCIMLICLDYFYPPA